MSFAAVGVAVAVIAAGVSAYTQADAAQKQANYQAQVAANNAKIQLYQRSAALQEGEQRAADRMTEQAALLSTQRATFASNGVDLNSGGTVTDVLASTKFLGQQDVNAIQSNAARQAWGYDVNRINYESESNLERWRAASISPGLNAGLAMLSTAGSYAARG